MDYGFTSGRLGFGALRLLPWSIMIGVKGDTGNLLPVLRSNKRDGLFREYSMMDHIQPHRTS